MATRDEVPYRPMIRDLPQEERPRERLARHDAGSLSNAELVAILLRVGIGGENVIDLSRRLLHQIGQLPGLARASLTDLQSIKGIGLAKAAQLKAALELGKRLAFTTPEAKPQISSAADAANLLLGDMSFLDREQMRVLLLDTKHRVLDAPTIYVGSLNTSVVRIGELFRRAISRNCAAIIIAHNHPSGDPEPSPEDVAVTQQIVNAGKLLDIEVLDHLIIGEQRFLSLRERGLGFA